MINTTKLDRIKIYLSEYDSNAIVKHDVMNARLLEEGKQTELEFFTIECKGYVKVEQINSKFLDKFGLEIYGIYERKDRICLDITEKKPTKHSDECIEHLEEDQRHEREPICICEVDAQ